MAKLYFYFSTMNAGKTTTLLQSAYNYGERGQHVELYTAQLDDRAGVGKIASRIGLASPANLFDANTDMYTDIENRHKKQSIDCVFIDESQFLTKNQVRELGHVADKLDIPVLAYGIRTDFRGELFEGSKYLLAWADNLNEIKTICHCGRKANMVVRTDGQGTIVEDGEQVQIGGNDTYVSLCRRHFYERKLS